MKRTNKRGKLLMGTGLLCLIAAVSLMVYNGWDEHRAAAESKDTLHKLEASISDKALAGTGAEERNGMPVLLVDGVYYIGVLSIPAIHIEIPVALELNSANLKGAPCLYKSSCDTGEMIIAGHNYESHFGGLSGLETGDRIYFADVNGNTRQYIVSDIEVLGNSDVQRMTEGDWDLTLFTCTYGGEHRITVRCTVD